MRKLASIRLISDVVPIPDADKIQLAIVDGWQVVVKRDEFKPGDYSVYMEPDSFVSNSLCPWLTKPGNKPREYQGILGERLRTVRLRKTLSQGLLLPLSVIPGFDSYDVVEDSQGQLHFISNRTNARLSLGDDVSDLLGVVKYEPPIPACLSGMARGNWPSQIPKTDEERIQNLTREWPYYKTLKYEVTEKLNGSSMTCGIVNDEFIVCSRNINLKETEDNSFWIQARRYDFENKLRSLELNDIVIQAEICGPKIQGNPYNLSEADIFVFSVYDAKQGRYLTSQERTELIYCLDLKHVPIVHHEFCPDDMDISDILEMANGSSVINPQTIREGFVFKTLDSTVHWKAISNEFLLKQH